MNSYEEKKIVIYANPEELRNLADEMEDRWPKLKPGQPTFIKFLVNKDGLKVCLHLDQQYFHKMDKDRESHK